ncbi:hypothetical protein AZE42_13179 [Rhizopogon vesiculosus]|uniref:Uncharacterized protein n=1 Tax=Rhizopogon vesiculosus TaxID=180088 RepID=A0A1J8QG10_9AGAM|nr:hypothetical protein AZE42_13179 [Rhizopogon vesiculosus]
MSFSLSVLFSPRLLVVAGVLGTSTVVELSPVLALVA